jgi:hypothetical protein
MKLSMVTNLELSLWRILRVIYLQIPIKFEEIQDVLLSY